jgi:hypothetical protein
MGDEVGTLLGTKDGVDARIAGPCVAEGASAGGADGDAGEGAAGALLEPFAGAFGPCSGVATGSAGELDRALDPSAGAALAVPPDEDLEAMSVSVTCSGSSAIDRLILNDAPRCTFLAACM